MDHITRVISSPSISTMGFFITTRAWPGVIALHIRASEVGWMGTVAEPRDRSEGPGRPFPFEFRPNVS